MSEDLTRADSELLKLRQETHAAVGNEVQIQHRLDEFEAAVEKRAAAWIRTQTKPGARVTGDFLARLAATLDPEMPECAPPWRPQP
jgi:hypothetical protein